MKKIFGFWGAFLNSLGTFGRTVGTLWGRVVLWTKLAKTSAASIRFKKRTRPVGAPAGSSAGVSVSDDTPNEEENKQRFWRGVFIGNGIALVLSILVFFFVPPMTINGVAVWNWGAMLLFTQLVYSVVYPLLPLFWERGEVEISEEVSQGAINPNETDEERKNRKSAGILTTKEYAVERMTWKSGKYPTVPSQTVGMLKFMGALLYTLPDGFVYLPPFFEIERDTKKIVQFELPPSELIHWGSGEIPEGMYAPLRFGQVGKPSKTEAEENNPLSNNQTMDGSIQARIRIDGKSLYQYFTTIGTLKNAEKMILDAMVSKVQAILGKKTPLWTKRNFDKVNEKISNALEEFVVGWGVVALDVYLVNYDYSHETNKSMRGVVVAEFERKATVTKAKGEKEKLELEGNGEGKKRQKILEGEAAGRKKIALDLGVRGDQVLDSETTRLVAGNVQNLDVINPDLNLNARTIGKLFDQGAKSNNGNGGDA
ncbi:MAG: hypothetical protein HGA67_01345 [Candidatus Yonathbacteria bacterium]|nr:hypothetical protein [Candidatus Yonathbacteria bacterium]